MTRVYWWLRNHPQLVAYTILVGLNFAGWRSLEAERHDRCVDGRTDIKRSFLVVADELTDISTEDRHRLDVALTDTLNIDDC